MKTKDIVKCVDTKNLKDKADCFKRGEDWYEVEPKWDRRSGRLSIYGERADYFDLGRPHKWQHYKELEVTEDGEPVGYVERTKSFVAYEEFVDAIDDYTQEEYSEIMKYYTQKQIDELTAGYEKWFYQFIFGQDCPLIDGECAYWKSDVDRFLKINGLPVGEGNEM